MTAVKNWGIWSILAGIVAVTAIISFFVFDGPKRVGWLWDRLFSDVAVSAVPARLNLGQKATVTVLLDGGPVAPEYRCSWSTDGRVPLLHKLPRSGDCGPHEVRVPDHPFGPLDQIVDTEIKIRIWNPDWELDGASVLLRVRNQANIVLRPSRRRVVANSTVTLRLLFNDKMPEKSFQCTWEYEHGTITAHPPSGCRADYTAPINMPRGGDGATVRITAVLWGEGTSRVGEASVALKVLRPPRHFYGFVVDSSARMSRRLNGQTLLESVVNDLIEEVKNIKLDGGYVSVEVFGGEPKSEGAESCKNSVTLIPTEPLNVERVKSSVRILHPGDVKAPLGLAIKHTLLGWAPKTQLTDRYYLITFTGGPDNCRGENFAADLRHLRETVTVAKMRNLWLEYRLLTLTIAIMFSKRDQKKLNALRRSSEYEKEPHLILKVDDEKTLELAVRWMTQLSGEDTKQRTVACGGLVRLFVEQEDNIGKRRMEKYCNQLNQR